MAGAGARGLDSPYVAEKIILRIMHTANSIFSHAEYSKFRFLVLSDIAVWRNISGSAKGTSRAARLAATGSDVQLPGNRQ